MRQVRRVQSWKRCRHTSHPAVHRVFLSYVVQNVTTTMGCSYTADSAIHLSVASFTDIRCRSILSGDGSLAFTQCGEMYSAQGKRFGNQQQVSSVLFPALFVSHSEVNLTFTLRNCFVAYFASFSPRLSSLRAVSMNSGWLWRPLAPPWPFSQKNRRPICGAALLANSTSRRCHIL